MSPVCVVSGASGYVGGVIARYFLDQGWTVRGLSRHRPALFNSRFEYVRADLASGISPHNAFEKADVFVHAAYDFSPSSRSDVFHVNVDGSVRFLEAAHLAGVGRILVVSSISAFEGCRSLYGQAKLRIEKKALDVKAVVVRPGLVCGPRAGAMFGRLARAVERLPILPVLGGETNRLFLISQSDLARAIFELSQAPTAASSVVTLAHPVGVTFHGILSALARSKGKSPLYVPVPLAMLNALLKTLEVLRIPFPFRSDSLVSLMAPNPHVDFSGIRKFGLHVSPFEEALSE